MSGKERLPDKTPWIDWGVVTMPMEGHAESGDHHLVKEVPEGSLLAVVDGLGHGAEAAEAAKQAIAALEAFAHESIIALLKRCNEQVRNTRGVVMSLALINVNEETLTWLGVGNVEGVLLRADAGAKPPRENILLRGGLLGPQLPPLRASVLTLSRGDTLIFATDGIHTGFAEGVNIKEPAQQIAEGICKRHNKGTDDALVLVARYLGVVK